MLNLTINGYCYLHWGWKVSVAFFMRGLGIAPTFFNNRYKKIKIRDFNEKYLKKNADETCYFDILGVKLPDFSVHESAFFAFIDRVFDDTFLIHAFYQDNYDKSLIDKMDKRMLEGPYGYKDWAFDVTIKKDDVVIDAGAWVGDFAAYATAKGATTYAFEPVQETFNILCRTADLNKGKIYPVKRGLGDNESELDISINESNSSANSFVLKDEKTSKEKINITTLDKFVEENKLERVDFIKADIEGAERDLLKGAMQTLKRFAPKLAICTYHLPDDPEVLEKIILDANPNYKIVHLRHKLFAAVV